MAHGSLMLVHVLQNHQFEMGIVVAEFLSETVNAMNAESHDPFSNGRAIHTMLIGEEPISIVARQVVLNNGVLEFTTIFGHEKHPKG